MLARKIIEARFELAGDRGHGAALSEGAGVRLPRVEQGARRGDRHIRDMIKDDGKNRLSSTRTEGQAGDPRVELDSP